MAFVDLRKAYDMVPRELLLKKLAAMGTGEDFVRLQRMSFDRTTARVWLNGGMSAPFPIRRGVPQGDPLSPLLFSPFLDDLLRQLDASKEFKGLDIKSQRGVRAALKALAYADDLVLAATSPYQLQIALNIVGAWAQQWGMEVNTSKGKTEVMVFPPALTPAEVKLRDKKEQAAAARLASMNPESVRGKATKARGHATFEQQQVVNMESVVARSAEKVAAATAALSAAVAAQAAAVEVRAAAGKAQGSTRASASPEETAAAAAAVAAATKAINAARFGVSKRQGIMTSVADDAIAAANALAAAQGRSAKASAQAAEAETLAVAVAEAAAGAAAVGVGNGAEDDSDEEDGGAGALVPAAAAAPPPPPYSFTICGKPIGIVEKYDYLGFRMTPALHPADSLRARWSTANFNAWKWRALHHGVGGFPIHVLSTVFMATVLPHLEQCSGLWSPGRKYWRLGLPGSYGAFYGDYAIHAGGGAGHTSAFYQAVALQEYSARHALGLCDQAQWGAHSPMTALLFTELGWTHLPSRWDMARLRMFGSVLRSPPGSLMRAVMNNLLAVRRNAAVSGQAAHPGMELGDHHSGPH